MIRFMNIKNWHLPIYLSLAILVLSVSTLSAISFIPDVAPYDPNNSQILLEGKDFYKKNIFSHNTENPRYTIQVSTMGRGDPLYVWFGHSAIVVKDNVNDRSVMYDYGIFSFSEGFYKTFALGRLWYESWATDTAMRFRLASSENRDISLVTLNLSGEVALNVLNFVNMSVQPEHTTYLYHHYRENCSTKIRDIINVATKGKFKEWATTTPYPLTIRELVSLHTASSPFIHFTLNFLQNKSIDTPISLWEAMFLPEKLEEALLSFNITQEDGSIIPLVVDREIINSAPQGLRPANDQSKTKANLIMIAFSIVLALILYISRRIMTHTIFKGIRNLFSFIYSFFSISWTLVATIFSTVLIFMMVASNHDVTYFNENILIISPLSILLLISSIRRAFSKEKNHRFYEEVNSVALILMGFLIILKFVFPDYLYQHNIEMFLIMSPLYYINSTFSRPFYHKKTRIINNKNW